MTQMYAIANKGQPPNLRKLYASFAVALAQIRRQLRWHFKPDYSTYEVVRLDITESSRSTVIPA